MFSTKTRMKPVTCELDFSSFDVINQSLITMIDSGAW